MIHYFDQIYIIALPDRKEKTDFLTDSLQKFYPECEPRVFDAVDTRALNNHHIGCALSHRKVIEDAHNKKLRRILIFEEDALLHRDFKACLDLNIAELSTLEWDLFKLGGHVWDNEFSKVPGCEYLEVDTASTCTQGYAINHSLFQYVLDCIPDNVEALEKWLPDNNLAIDQWYLNWLMKNSAPEPYQRSAANCYMSSPRLVTQPFLMHYSRQDSASNFLLPQDTNQDVDPLPADLQSVERKLSPVHTLRLSYRLFKYALPSIPGEIIRKVRQMLGL